MYSQLAGYEFNLSACEQKDFVYFNYQASNKGPVS